MLYYEFNEFIFMMFYFWTTSENGKVSETHAQ